ncbi:Lsm5p [Strigomonas culicis]|uniref:Lsm5p n=1 Tax=Strigomonas culicis TaxID=28005 RepID=S9UL10_9TRYP|nr:Lsm5p [Strigomonas culicis]EPY30832.1 Lsm5p [Strigomonas culicis]|eukprot:EPY29588.1 Lsm5p [Strigomonas culicis]
MATTLASLLVVEKKNLIDYLGCRITVDLDDGSRVTGRLLSLDGKNNMVFSDAERVRTTRKRSRNCVGVEKRECYTAVLFIRGEAITAVSFNKNITTDKQVIDKVGGKTEVDSRRIDIAGISPAVPN